MSFNVAFEGRLGKDPSVLQFKGKPVTKMFVITSRRRMVDGAWTDTDVSGWGVTAFNDLANSVSELSKGDPVIVVGRIREDRWIGKDGQERKGVSIVADSIGLGCRKEKKDEAVDDWGSSSPF